MQNGHLENNGVLIHMVYSTFQEEETIWKVCGTGLAAREARDGIRNKKISV